MKTVPLGKDHSPVGAKAICSLVEYGAPSLGTAIDITTEHASVGIHVQIVINRSLLRPDDGIGLGFRSGNRALHVGPLVIASAHDQVDFLASVLADFSVPDLAAHRIEGQAM